MQRVWWWADCESLQSVWSWADCGLDGNVACCDVTCGGGRRRTRTCRSTCTPPQAATPSRYPRPLSAVRY
eukprot:3394560-Rhodomonas_salina.1